VADGPVGMLLFLEGGILAFSFWTLKSMYRANSPALILVTVYGGLTQSFQIPLARLPSSQHFEFCYGSHPGVTPCVWLPISPTLLNFDHITIVGKQPRCRHMVNKGVTK